MSYLEVGDRGSHQEDIGGSNVGAGCFLNGVSVTTDQAPDIIVKAAWDPGWGHYELFGIQRFFTDNTFCSSAIPTGCTVNTTDTKTSYGTGVGGSVLLPAIPKYLDLQASIMYGRGIGRYGSGQLPDVTIAADGSLAPNHRTPRSSGARAASGSRL